MQMVTSTGCSARSSTPHSRFIRTLVTAAMNARPNHAAPEIARQSSERSAAAPNGIIASEPRIRFHAAMARGSWRRTRSRTATV
jgi:hypothetical protein